MINSDGLLYKKNLKIGIDELQWLQEENLEIARVRRMATMHSYGLVLPRLPGGVPDRAWTVDDADDDGTITVRVGSVLDAFPQGAMAIDDEGYVLVQPEDEDILTLPNNGVWYTVLVQRTSTEYAPGTVQLTAGSAVVIGTGTKFLRFSGLTTDGYGRGTKFRIDAGDSGAGNAGTYVIDVIVSDTEIHLTAAVPGGNESGIPFTIAGDYATAAPADPDIHRRTIPAFTRVPLTREPAAGLIPLCDCKRDDAAGPPKVVFVDRRAQRAWHPAVVDGGRSNAGAGLQIATRMDLTAGSLTTTAQKTLVFGPLAVATTIGICPWPHDTAHSGRILAMVASATDGLVHPMREDDTAVFGQALTATGGTFIGTQPTVVGLDESSGYDICCLYIDGGVLYARLSSDNGTTWAAANVVLDPTVNDPADLCSFPHAISLINGRLCCAVVYFDNSLALNKYSIVTVTSDDYGTTWANNGGVGFPAMNTTVVAGPASVSRPCLAQDSTGRIWLAAEHESNICLITSSDPSGRFSGGAQSVAAIGGNSDLLDKLGTYDNLTNPALWISPGGAPVIVYHAYDAGTTLSDVRYATIARTYSEDIPVLGTTPFYVQHEERIFTDNSGVGALFDLGMCMVQEQGGGLALAWARTVGAQEGWMLRLNPVALELQEGALQRTRT